MHGVVTLGLLALGIWILVLMANALWTGRLALKASAPIDRKEQPGAFWAALCLCSGVGGLLIAMAAKSVFRAYLGSSP